jgi:hypothetical protein
MAHHYSGTVDWIFSSYSEWAIDSKSCASIEREMHIMNHNFDILLAEVKKSGSLKKERQS